MDHFLCLNTMKSDEKINIQRRGRKLKKKKKKREKFE